MSKNVPIYILDDLQYLGALGPLGAAYLRDRYGKARFMIYSMRAA